MKKHVEYTEGILKDANINQEFINLSCNHHENLDGTGYPKRIDKSNLSIGDRIISISDIFCALTEKRHYKNELSKEEVISIMDKMVKSNHIDQDIYDIVKSNYYQILNNIKDEKENYEQILFNMREEFYDISNKMKMLNI